MSLTLLVFSDDWGEHPSSCQHIFKHIIKDHPVVWVNTLGMRLPRLSRQDALKAVKKLKRMLLTVSKSQAKEALSPNLSVLQPFMIPYNKGLFRGLNRRFVVKAVRQELSRRALESPILVTTVPNACDYIGAFGEKRVVYYCVDDFAEWPGHERDLILRMEENLIKKADLFIATSEKLYQRLEKYGKPTFLLPHGVDLEAFTKIPAAAEHQALAHIPRPRVGYVGLIDARLDWGLVRYLVSKLSKVSFVFIGRVEIDLAPLNEYPNFYHVSPVPYTEVPLVLKSLDVLMLPYLVNDFTQTINPLKLKEYLASGQEIIGAPLQEIEKYKDFLELGYDPSDWLAKLKKLLFKREEDLGKRLDLLAWEDWAFKAQEFLSICLGKRAL